VDSWIWSVRLARTRPAASGACRGGHVRVNGVRVKPAHAIRAGDEVRLRQDGRERVVVVVRVITKLATCTAVRGTPAASQEGCQFPADDKGKGKEISLLATFNV
jgi:ribosomal 50S subunit-recycling heat shock protein